MKHVLFVLLFAPMFATSQRYHYQVEVVKSAFYVDKEVIIAPSIFTRGNEYNEAQLKLVSLDAKQQRYQFGGSLNYPVPVSFSYLKKEGEVRRAVTSDFLFLDSGSSFVTLGNLEEDNEIHSQVGSRSNTEYSALKRLYRHLELATLSPRKLVVENIEKKDKILKDYVASNPDSYVAMWVLINDYEIYGYSEIKEETTQLFSRVIRSTQPFISLVDKMRSEKSVAINRTFPFSRFTFGQKMKAVVASSAYTLIDFWGSYCKPCIAQFPALKKIYTRNKPNGFEIYSISTDSRSNVKRMDSILKRNKIHWANSVDLSGIQSSRLNIHAIPSNFLLDSTGKIIAANLSMPDLEKFLKSKE